MTDTAWITPAYPWDDEPVAGTFYRTQARALVRLGCATTVVCATPWAPWPLPRARPRWRRYADAPRLDTDEGVVVARPRYPNLPGEPSRAMPDRFIARAAWGARATWAGASIVHGHTAVTGLAAWRLAQRAGLPHVLTFHGSDMNTWPDDHPERVADLRAAARSAASVFAVSQALATRVEAVTGVVATHLPIGSDHAALAALAQPRDLARKLLDLPADRTVVLFVGNLLPAKGVRALAEAILTVGDPFHGVFVGSGPELGYGGDDPIRGSLLDYRGARPHAEIPTYMSAADVLVLPSSREGLPTVLVEAGSLHLPVIASAVGGIPELLGDGCGAMLPEVSAAAIAGALLHFAAHRAEATKAADRLRERVLGEYDVDTNAAHLIESYRSAAARHGRSAVR